MFWSYKCGKHDVCILIFLQLILIPSNIQSKLELNTGNFIKETYCLFTSPQELNKRCVNQRLKRKSNLHKVFACLTHPWIEDPWFNVPLPLLRSRTQRQCTVLHFPMQCPVQDNPWLSKYLTTRYSRLIFHTHCYLSL